MEATFDLNSIVKIQTGPLEALLQGIKKQLSKHEEEIQNPTWLKRIKEEISSLSQSITTSEHAFRDVEAIRETLYNKKNELDFNAESKLALIRSDLENVRLLARKLDLRSAKEQILMKENENATIINEMTGKSSENAGDFYLEERLNKKIAALIDKQNAKIDHLEHNVHVLRETGAMQDIPAGDLGDLSVEEGSIISSARDRSSYHVQPGFGGANAQELLRSMNMLQTEQGNHTNRIVELCDQIANLKDSISYSTMKSDRRLKLFIIYSKFQNVMKFHRSWQITTAFRIWKDNAQEMEVESLEPELSLADEKAAVIELQNAMNKKERCSRVVAIFDRYCSNLMTNVISWRLNIWRANALKRKTWEKRKGRMIPYLEYWVSRVKPDIKRYFKLWKINIVMSPLSFTAENDVEILTSRLKKLCANTSQDFFGGLNRHVAGSERVVVTGICSALTEYLNSAYMKTRDGDILSKQTAVDLKNLSKLLEKNIFDMGARVKHQFDLYERDMNAYKATVAEAQQALRNKMHENEQYQLSKHVNSDNRYAKLEERMAVFDSRFSSIDAKMDRILLLQGNLLERLKSIEDRLSKQEEMTTVHSEDIVHAVKTSASALEEVAKSKSNISDTFTFFDSELKYLKVFAKSSAENLKKFQDDFTTITTKTRNHSKELKRRMDNLTDSLSLHAKPDPTAQELFDLYLQYENAVIEGLAQGLSTPIAFTDELASEIGKFAYRLAAWIAREVDLGTLRSVMNGPQPPALKSVAGMAAGGLLGKEKKELEIGNEHTLRFVGVGEVDVVQKREEVLQKFNNVYLEMFNYTLPRKGLGAREEARVVFNRRFYLAVDAAISSHEALVTISAQNVVSNPSANACMSCNRPLTVGLHKYSKSWQAMQNSNTPSTPARGRHIGFEEGKSRSPSPPGRNVEPKYADMYVDGDRTPYDHELNPPKTASLNPVSLNDAIVSVHLQGTPKRPHSASNLSRHKKAIKDSSSYVLRGGFKLPVKTSELSASVDILGLNQVEKLLLMKKAASGNTLPHTSSQIGSYPIGDLGPLVSVNDSQKS